MSSRALAHRCRWLEFFQESHLSSIRAFVDSRQFVVLKESPRIGYNPESVEGESLLHSLRETRGGRLVLLLELPVENHEGRLRKLSGPAGT